MQQVRNMSGKPAMKPRIPGTVPEGFMEPSTLRRRTINTLHIITPLCGFGIMGAIIWSIFISKGQSGVSTNLLPQLQYLTSQQTPNEDTVSNWSETHVATPQRIFHPETSEEVEVFLQMASGFHQRLRAVGSRLSPNGMSLSNEGVLDMSLMDKVLNVNVDRKEVTVQAGCRIQTLLQVLKDFDLTLPDVASISQQQIGGYIQTGAHGSGTRIAPLDEHVTEMILVTPAMGQVKLSAIEEPELFKLARVGLGSLGVVTELTIKCVPRQFLVEKTFTATPAEVKKNHATWLKNSKHLRYMWLPYTDTVVVVQVNPTKESQMMLQAERDAARLASTLDERLASLRHLFVERGLGDVKAANELTTFAELRQHLLAAAPLDPNWVAKVNAAEAQYWKLSSGSRGGYPEAILGFDCGGQQVVLETAFPVGPLSGFKAGRASKDLKFVEDLLKEIKTQKLPAPGPIEQRWTAGSSSPLSPVSVEEREAGGAGNDAAIEDTAANGDNKPVFSWVGVIAYLPPKSTDFSHSNSNSSSSNSVNSNSNSPSSQTEGKSRQEVLEWFRKTYVPLVEEKLMAKASGVWHWGKLELPIVESKEEGEEKEHAGKEAVEEVERTKRYDFVRSRLNERYGATLKRLRQYRDVLDPTDMLGNKWLDALWPRQRNETVLPTVEKTQAAVAAVGRSG